MDLSTYIETLNAKTAAWVAEDPDNRWAGMLVSTVEHWAEYGITSIREFNAYLDAEDAKEARKNSYMEREEEYERRAAEAHAATVEAMLENGAPDREIAERWAALIA